MTSRWIWALVLGVLGAALYVGSIGAASSGFTGTTLVTGRFGELDSHVKSGPWLEMLKTKGNSDLYVQSNVWQPGGTTGWHTHPGPSLLVVTEGSITVYDGDDPTCTPHVYTAGTPNNTLVDPGDGHVHIIRNETSAEAKDIAVQLIPAGATRTQGVSAPGNCSF